MSVEMQTRGRFWRAPAPVPHSPQTVGHADGGALPLTDPGQAPARTEALIARVCAVLRLAQLVPWPVAMVLGPKTGIQHVWLAAAAYAAQTGWSLAWAVTVLVRRRIVPGLIVVDTAVAAAALVGAGLACYPQDSTSWANSAVAPAMGAAVAAAATSPPLRSALCGVLLAAAYFAGVSEGLSQSQTAWAAAIGNVCSLIGFGVIAGLTTHYLMRQARSAASAAVELAAARARTAAEESRERERARQYRMLHDTVLSTLSALARGGLDPSDPLVRQRCAADADYLRGLISSGGVSAGNHLQGELAAIGRSQAPIGLRVHLHCADIPPDLPTDVVRALSDATREALNNVIKHSGADQAWVTALGSEPMTQYPDFHPETGLGVRGRGAPGVTVTIADRGHGFDPAATGFGLGLRESIGGRMTEIGGSMHIDSSPGQGTSVELSWPA
ncbi:signal transduction histidine kinase [Catenulispora sp. EB89]|uniref:sensor histidine kinase n=1 Tax=Catenulispora sp. EB89 TaxID=3156257 RepID=UPI0035174766